MGSWIVLDERLNRSGISNENSSYIFLKIIFLRDWKNSCPVYNFNWNYIWNETVRYRCKINFMKLIYDPVIYIRIILFSTRVFCSRNVSNFRWFGISLFNFQFPSSKFPNRKRYRDKITFSRGTFFSFFKSKQHAYIYIHFSIHFYPATIFNCLIN